MLIVGCIAMYIGFRVWGRYMFVFVFFNSLTHCQLYLCGLIL
ncbi:hypothetical protein HanPI659440_Chr03g0114391 [Helianthus annuus]|nr:hypothetical protein HanPI659440_Chr03g0114391 [Helianthus annuus]